MKIKIYFFGKKNEISDWEQDYLRRINFRVSTELIALPQAGIKNPQKAKELEAKEFMSKIKEGDFVLALDEKGSHKDSIQFASWFRSNLETQGSIILVMGGAHGLAPEILQRANAKIAFGSMVWTRNLVRLMTCEQIYRALEIEAGGNFHKA